MKCVKIIHKKNAMALVPKLADHNTRCYYLVDDYIHFADLRDKLSDKVNVQNLSGLFQQTFQEIKEPFLELISKLNKENDSLAWWGGQLASRNTASTPLLLNITYLFCAKKTLSNSNDGILFIVESKALFECISNVAEEAGYRVKIYRNRVHDFVETINRWFYILAQGLYYFLRVFQSRRAALKLLTPLPAKKTNKRKRVILRSWVTKGNFNEAGEFKDRNFGSLPAWLNSKNYEVWHLPMFFSLSRSIKEVYALMKEMGQPLLIPDHYIKIMDYLNVFRNGLKMQSKRIGNVDIKHTNVAPIFDEVTKKLGLDPAMLILNLCVPLLKRLKEKGYEIDGFYYSFEGNAPEKPFILGCKQFYPEAEIIGFQHTTFFPAQLAYHLGPGEKEYHPLPDKLVCSGPIYIDLHKKAGFPSEILVSGPNLRFESVYYNNGARKNIPDHKKNLLLPLPGLPYLVFELFMKVAEALRDTRDYKVYIRSHPALSKKCLIEYLNKVGLKDFEFADEGIIQEWLPSIYATISAGASITILESISMGVPVIRVVPDNTIFYDPFPWPDYPLEPVDTPLMIKEELERIEEIKKKDKTCFQRIAENALENYFARPTEENLKVFL